MFVEITTSFLLHSETLSEVKTSEDKETWKDRSKETFVLLRGTLYGIPTGVEVFNFQ
jgi:hypothetical protein